MRKFFFLTMLFIGTSLIAAAQVKPQLPRTNDRFAWGPV